MTLSSLRPPLRGRPRRRAQGGSPGWFRAFWRWHFYASFLVAPVLIVLAVTGLIYLFRFQLEPLLHPDLMRVEAQSATQIQQPYSAQLSAVERAYPDATVGSMREPGSTSEPTVFSATWPDGSPHDIYVNPYGAKVLGELSPDTTLSGYAVRIHADLMAGTLGDRVTELAACWAIVMSLTGYYLYVKGRRARQRRPRSLRNRHATVGLVAGVGLLLLLVSGLPWTGLWGSQMQKLATHAGSSMWGLDPGALSDPQSTLDESLPHSHADRQVPWAQQESPVPRGHDRSGSVANVDTAVAVAEAEGLRHPMTVALPAGAERAHHGTVGGTGVYSVIGYAFDAPSDERTVHVDRYGGQVLATYGFEDYPLLAKVVAQGIGLHEGRSLGRVSMILSTLMCLAILASCVTGPLMWWRRRPRGHHISGRLGAPRGRLPVRASPVLAVGLVVLGVFLPLFGLSLLVILALDQLVVRRVPALAGFFGSS